MDEMSLKRAIAKGDQAQTLIESHKDLWGEIEDDLWQMWRSSKADDRDGRESLYHEQHAIKSVQARLTRIVNEGKKAQEELKQQRDGNRNRT